MVTGGNHTDKKWVHMIDIADLVETLVIERDKLTLNGGIRCCLHCHEMLQKLKIKNFIFRKEQSMLLNTLSKDSEIIVVYHCQYRQQR
jgi:hypothetical protein